MLLKVNELAKSTGLSVRSLHHYDSIGLLRPSRRSEKGFRLYTHDDVIRLHRIQTLKQLGYSLSEIMEVLASNAASPLEIITQQIEVVTTKIHHAQMLLSRLNHLREKFVQGADPAQTDWLAALEMMSMYESHFTRSEILHLRTHWDNAGRNLDAAWKDAILAVQKAIAEGVEPTSATGSDLGRRWVELLRETTGDDPGLVRKLKQIHGEGGRLGELSGVSPEMIQWISRAIAAMRAATAQEKTAVRIATQDSHNLMDELSAHPKPTALIVGLHRAVHQLMDAPLVFEDPLACQILGEGRFKKLKDNLAQFDMPLARAVRTSIVVRSRLAEDEWRVSKESGIRQCVIMGAGLDTLAYRAHGLSHCRIFEVDLPSTQQWKRDFLRASTISEPSWLTYVPIDFDAESLPVVMERFGFINNEPAFFSWLGVTMYLDEDAIDKTLAFIGSLAPGSKVVFDYLVRPELLSERERAARVFLLQKTAEFGEPQKAFFDPSGMVARVRTFGFSHVQDMDAEELSHRYLGRHTNKLHLGKSSRIIVATV